MSERNPGVPRWQRVSRDRVDRGIAGAYLGRTSAKEGAMTEETLSVPMDEFRVHCLELIDTTGEPVVVTRLGSPVARLQPCRPPRWRPASADDEDPWSPCWDPEAVE
jgi:hypothetical protein